MNYILCGLPTSGKTTIGKKLAEAIQRPFIDLDDLIKKIYKETTGAHATCREICRREGVSHFRLLEKNALQQILSLKKSVIALGGGTLDDSENRQLISDLGTLIYLNVDPSLIWKRIELKGGLSFLDQKDPKNDFDCLAKKRQLIYEKVAHLKIDPKDWKSLLNQLQQKEKNGQ